MGQEKLGKRLMRGAAPFVLIGAVGAVTIAAVYSYGSDRIEQRAKSEKMVSLSRLGVCLHHECYNGDDDDSLHQKDACPLKDSTKPVKSVKPVKVSGAFPG